MLRCGWDGFAAQKIGLIFFFCRWHYPCSTSVAWGNLVRLGWFCSTKGQRDFKSTLTFVASHEACRRMAAFPNSTIRNPHQTGEPGHLSGHGGKTPANPHVPLRPCAAMPRSPGCRALALPEGAVRVAGHTPVAAGAETDGAYLGTVGNAVPFELLLEETA